MKYLLGIVIGAGLVFGAQASAETVEVHGIQVVQRFIVDGVWNRNPIMRKYYDYDNNVVCYTFSARNGTSISCLKN